MKNIVIVGGGFAGLWAGLTAARELDLHGGAARITLVTKDEYLTVRPRLYEVFSEGLRAPLRPVLEPLGIQLQLGTVQDIDRQQRSVHLSVAGGESLALPYDRLIFTAGSEQRPLEIPGAAKFALNIDTFAAAQTFDRHLQDVLRAPDRPGRLTFIIVGGGFTGIELATEMRTRIRAHSDAATARKARIILIERGNVIGRHLGANPRPAIEAALREAQVEIYFGASVAQIERDAVRLTDDKHIDASTVVVTTGLRANPLVAQLGANTDDHGRVIVDEMLRVNGAHDIFAAGDAACAKADEQHAALMSCQHAIPMGKYAGYNAAHDVLGTPLRPYSQPNYVTCLDLGESGALFTVGWERKPEKSGAVGKQLKQTINTQWIYPPSGSRESILAAADLDGVWPPAV
ncbi:MAG: FAD-dependent oxidoreductase [Nitrospira sp.]|nr:FAD-dependent oxidoreductase [Nitrospira sp.]